MPRECFSFPHHSRRRIGTRHTSDRKRENGAFQSRTQNVFEPASTSWSKSPIAVFNDSWISGACQDRVRQHNFGVRRVL
jgi:hypothetical protein